MLDNLFNGLKSLTSLSSIIKFSNLLKFETPLISVILLLETSNCTKLVMFLIPFKLTKPLFLIVNVLIFFKLLNLSKFEILLLLKSTAFKFTSL